MRNLFRKQTSYVTIPAQARPARDARHADGQGDGLWVRCGNEHCRELLYVREFEKNLKVCHKCEYHARLTAQERVEQIVDEGTFQEKDEQLAPSDPLGFAVPGNVYAEKVKESRIKAGHRDAAFAGTGEIEGLPLELVVLDFAFMGASMGSVVGEKIVRAVDRARAARSAVVTVSTGGGARMQEGILSLMQMAKTVAALGELADDGVPHISVFTDPTLGGITASYAGIGDVIIAEQGALIGFAGSRVIEQTTKQKLPPDAQRAQFLLDHGMVDLVLPRRELRPTLARLLRLYAAAQEQTVTATATHTPATRGPRAA